MFWSRWFFKHPSRLVLFAYVIIVLNTEYDLKVFIVQKIMHKVRAES